MYVCVYVQNHTYIDLAACKNIYIYSILHVSSYTQDVNIKIITLYM